VLYYLNISRFKKNSPRYSAGSPVQTINTTTTFKIVDKSGPPSLPAVVVPPMVVKPLQPPQIINSPPAFHLDINTVP
jgi:hypothetical protein